MTRGTGAASMVEPEVRREAHVRVGMIGRDDAFVDPRHVDPGPIDRQRHEARKDELRH